MTGRTEVVDDTYILIFWGKNLEKWEVVPISKESLHELATEIGKTKRAQLEGKTVAPIPPEKLPEWLKDHPYNVYGKVQIAAD